MGSYKVLYDYPNYASLPAVGDVSRLYITNDTNTLYRWVDGAYHFFTTTSVPWGHIDGVLTNQTDLMAVLNGKQPLITAGTTAQYYRGDKTFQTLNTTAVPEGTNLYWTDARFNTGFSGKTTSNLTEGTNLYYTQGRFDSAFSAKSTSNLSEGTNLYYTQGRFDSAFGAKSTSNLTEGTNLYYTDARFDSRLATKTTDNLTEGATRLYYSSARFNADFNSKTTSNLTEGTNYYWTPARSRNAMTLLTVGTGGFATYNSTTGELNIPQYQTLLTNPLVGAGAQYYVPRYSGTTTLTPGLIYDNGVYVGINRTNPFYTLDVNGSLNVEGTTILRAMAGTGNRLVYVDSTGLIIPAIIGGGLSLSGGTLSATGTASGSIGGSGSSNRVPKFTGSAAIGNSNIQDSGNLISLGSDTAINGFISGGVTSVLPAGNTFAGQTFNFTGSADGWGLINRNTFNINNDAFIVNGFVLQDNRIILNKTTGSVGGSGIFAGYQAFLVNSGSVTTQFTGFVSVIGGSGTGTITNFKAYSGAAGPYANTFSVTNFTMFNGEYAPLNVTNAFGLIIGSALSGSTLTRALDLNVTSGTNKFNIFSGGTANNYLAGSLLIGTTTDAGYKLDVNGTFRQTGSTTASGALAAGSTITPTLVAAANNDVLVGLDINPTFTTGSFTGVSKLGLRLQSLLQIAINQYGGTELKNLAQNGNFDIVGVSSNSGTVNIYGGPTFSDGAGISITGNTNGNPSSIIFNKNGFTAVGRFMASGNLILQNGGTFTDAGYRLDVNGAARIQNTLTATQFALSALNTAPATATSTGTLGEVRIDASYIYVCTATNTWKRAAITTW